MLKKKRQILGVFLSILVVASSFTPQAQSFFSLQDKQLIAVGETLELPLKFPLTILNTIDVRVKDEEKLLKLKGGELLEKSSYILGSDKPVVTKPGKVSLELRLFGFIPLKKINVDVLPNLTLVPGGHSIGVLLRTEGVMVVGHSPVLNESSEPRLPAKEADIEVGDIILEIEGTKVMTDDQVGTLINKIGQQKQAATIVIKRNGKLYKRVVYPQYCTDTKSYRIGLFVRDNAGGVGTLTFFDPVTKKYGALGHVITDGETSQKLNIRQGKILSASIEDIQMGKRGVPGEKVGVFLENTEFGNIEKNENCGIYGIMSKDIFNPLYKDPLPTAYFNQIHTGNAQILTVVKGQEIEQFNILIEKIMPGRADGKNMIIRIVDEKLLNHTGGIVQGMSGSPIIQDGKIVGAVTHVFVNDPTRGYGVFIENMLFEAGILQEQQKTLGQGPQGFFAKSIYFLPN
ncbi:MAG: SpoIVB peptidase [Bacillota bacterium]|uniref:SpoIVB peptidase n=1 Tax=Thermanaerosceptrum fracticalcis TaxID=1712410 RepID=A0A7G6E0E6_THEFR|nr:SpoIVB peptidase [Thermanaerosceptrum fracticalcis]QNB45550.1 SpoIVB peptidase [Thermanaerosceptrum fracticalcis]